MTRFNWSAVATYSDQSKTSWKTLLSQYESEISNELAQKQREFDAEQVATGRGLMNAQSCAQLTRDKQKRVLEIAFQQTQGAERQKQYDEQAAANEQVSEVWNRLKDPVLMGQYEQQAGTKLAKDLAAGGIDAEGNKIPAWADMDNATRTYLTRQAVYQDELATAANKGNTAAAHALKEYLDKYTAQTRQQRELQQQANQGLVTQGEVQGMGIQTATSPVTSQSAMMRRLPGTKGTERVNPAEWTYNTQLPGTRSGNRVLPSTTQPATENRATPPTTQPSKDYWAENNLSEEVAIMGFDPKSALQFVRDVGGAFKRAGKQMYTGYGDIVESIGGMLLSQDIDGSAFVKAGRNIKERGQKGIEPPIGELQELTDASYRSLPFMIAAMGAAATGNFSLAASGIGKIGTWILSSIIGTVGKRALEGMTEAGGTYIEGRQRNMTHEQAKKATNEVFLGNLNLTVSDMVEFGVAMAPLGKGTSSIVKPLIVAGKMIWVGLTEGGEELYQAYLQRKAMGDPWAWNPKQWSHETELAVKVGFVNGLLGGAGGHVISEVGADVRTKYAQVYDKAFKKAKGEGATDEMAAAEAIIAVAETPGGQEVVEAAIERTETAQPVQSVTPTPERAPSAKIQGTQPTGSVAQPAAQAPPTPVQSAAKAEAGTTSQTMAAEAPEEGMSLRVRLERPDYRKEAIRHIQSEMTRLNKAGLTDIKAPKVNKLLSAIEKADGPRKVKSAIAKAANIIETVERVNLIERINTELKQTVVKRTNPTAKVTVESQTRLNTIRKNVTGATYAGRQDALAAIDNATREVSEGRMSEDELDETIDKYEDKMWHLPSMSSDELRLLLSEIKGERKAGRAARAEAMKERKARRAKMASDGLAIISRGKTPPMGRYTTPQEVSTKGKPYLWVFSFMDFMEKLDMGDKGAPMRQGFHYRNFINTLVEARNKSEEIKHRYSDKLTTLVKQVFPDTNLTQVNRILSGWNDSKKKVYVGTFVNGRGEPIELHLTVAQMGSHYIKIQDLSTAETYENVDGMAWTGEILAAIENKLTDQQKALFDGLQEIVEGMGVEIAPIYEADYHLPWQGLGHYWPFIRDLGSRQALEKKAAWAGDAPGSTGGLLVALDMMGMSASPRNGSLIARIKNKVPFKHDSAFDTFGVHTARMAHYISHALVVKELRAYFGNPDIRDAIKQEKGTQFMAHIDKAIDDIARGSFDPKKVSKFLDTQRARFTRSVFGGKIPIIMKQLPSWSVYGLEIGFGDLGRYSADFLRHPVEAYREMVALSPTTKTRFGAGFDIDIQQEMARGRGLIENWRYRDIFTVGIRYGDRAQISMGQWAVYQHYLNLTQEKMTAQQRAAHPNGYSREDAMREAEASTERLQPSTGMFSIAALRRDSSLGRAMTMFTDQVNRYARLELMTLEGWKEGRVSTAQAAKTLFLMHIVIPVLIQLISDGFNWDKKHQIRAMATGPLDGILIAGDIVGTFIDQAFLGERFEWQASPLVTVPTELGYGVVKGVEVIKDWMDPLKDVDDDDLWAMFDSLLKAGGEMTGLPGPYAAQVAGAVREGEPEQLVFSRYALSAGEKEKKATPKTVNIRY